MDTTSCPPGMATDRAFLRNVPVGTCDVNVATFWGIVLSIAIARTIGFLGKVRNYVSTVGFTFKPRRVFSLLVSLSSTVSYHLMAILLGLNIVNAENGWSFTVYSIGYFSFIVDFSMMLFKIVRLGRRVIPLPRNQMTNSETDYLAKFTRTGMVLAFLQIIMACVSSVALIILSPIFPEHELLLGTIGFASKGIFQILCTLGMVLVS